MVDPGDKSPEAIGLVVYVYFPLINNNIVVTHKPWNNYWDAEGAIIVVIILPLHCQIDTRTKKPLV